MEATIDKVISELQALAQAPDTEGGLQNILEIKDVWFGDPGYIPIQMYPCIVVEPSNKSDAGETTGYDKRDLTIFITILVNAPEYFDQNVTELAGTRELVRASEQVERWFMRYSNRRLDFMPGVRALTIPLIDYDIPPRRGTIKVKTAQVTLVVQKQYSRQA